MDTTDLFVIMPTTRGIGAVKSIQSASKQVGFSNIVVLVAGKSSNDQELRRRCTACFGDAVRILPCPDKEHILPGEARNLGIDYVFSHGDKGSYLLFLDDDIVLPPDYAIVLKCFVDKYDLSAAMGRVVSYPINFWSKVIDYSNFWWLQQTRNCIDRGWLGAGATLMKTENTENIRFLTDISVNEDTEFFDQVTHSTGKKLGICSSTTCQHCHNRSSLPGLIRYQFLNGYYGEIYSYKKGKSLLLQAVRRWKNSCYVALGANRKYLETHLIEALGITVSFLLVEIGSLSAELIRGGSKKWKTK